MATESTDPNTTGNPSPVPTWTYPTRFCRICHEDVPATVTMFPPGLPLSFQHPIVEYRSEDEYGRLVKPCLCRGGMRYIHEQCLLRARTENPRADSMWQCHECKHKFNFQKFLIQRYLSSKYSSGTLTVLTMLIVMFILGFIADPIINFYLDPYDTASGRGSIWTEIPVKAPLSPQTSGWAQHFVKGLVSMGLVGFAKTFILHPFRWWNLRGGFMTTSTGSTSATGRDRAANISWIAVIIGISSAFYFFYQWVQLIIQKSLQRVGNNIVDTQLPGDDDDLKPPPGWKPEIVDDSETKAESAEDEDEDIETSSTQGAQPKFDDAHQQTDKDCQSDAHSMQDPQVEDRPCKDTGSSPAMAESWFVVNEDSDDLGRSSALDDAHKQDWSFSSRQR